MKPKLTAILSLLLFLCLSCSNENKDRFSYKLIPVQSDEKWGYIDEEGKFVINPQFNNAYLFSEGLAMVESAEGKRGYIGEDGKYVINPVYKFATNFSEGLAFVTPENGFPTCIDKKGKIKFVLKDADYVSTYIEGLSAVRVKEKWGFVDKNGKMTINAQFDAIADFSEGLAASGNKSGKADDDVLWGFIDKNGKAVINPQFKKANSFKEGLARVTDGKKFGYIDTKGQYVINPQFDEADDFSEGLAAVKQGKSWGYIDRKGKLTINAQFEEARAFKGGFAAVKSGKDNWGYIDQNGRIAINPQFKSAGVFAAAFAPVMSGDKLGFIDKEGKYMVNPQFDATYNYWSGISGFFFDGTSFEGVGSDYFDVKELVKSLLDKPDEPVFFGLNKSSSLTNIVNIAPFKDDLREDSRYTAIHTQDISVYGGVEIDKITLTFQHPIYSMVGEYLYGYRVGENKQFNSGARLESLRYHLNLGYYGRASGKEEIISEGIRDEFMKRFQCSDESADLKNVYKLRCNSYVFTIRYSENSVDLEVSFLSGEYQPPVKENPTT